MGCLLLLKLLGKGCFQLLHLTVEGRLPLIHLFLVGGFLGLQLFLQILHIGFLDVTLCRQFDDVVDQAFLSSISDEKAENRHHNDGYDGYNQVYFHNPIIIRWQRYLF